MLLDDLRTVVPNAWISAVVTLQRTTVYLIRLIDKLKERREREKRTRTENVDLRAQLEILN